MIGIVLTHNKGDQGNVAQIDAALALVDDHEVYVTDDQGVEQYAGHYYTLKGTGERVQFLHIVPYGVSRPSNIDTLDGHKVLYGAGDEDKVGDHPRFYNWGLKRATDLGSDVVIHLDDVSKFKQTDILAKVANVRNKATKEEFYETVGYRVSSLKLLREVGQIDEQFKGDKWRNFKNRIAGKGFLNG